MLGVMCDARSVAAPLTRAAVLVVIAWIEDVAHPGAAAR